MLFRPLNASLPLAPARPHFKALDGLRGVAALAVVTFHFMEMYIYDYSRLFIGHGFLAVDFFFCLSGFVIGYAYDGRVTSMGLATFFRARLIRLHPLVVSGTLLGLLALLLNPITPFTQTPLAHHPGRLALILLASLLLIPFPAMESRSFNNFSLNAPAWSLFWEYVANLVYALVLHRLNRRTLALLTLVSAVALCLVGAHAGHLSGGWSGPTFWQGSARVAFSFLAGLLLFRSGWRLRSPLGFGSLSILLLLALCMPYAEGAWLREALVILLLFPLLIALGAGATLAPRTQAVCTLAGDLSYPLYMTHYAVIWIWGDFAYKTHPDTAHLALFVTLGVLSMLAVAFAVMVFYDTPVRSALSRRFLAKSPAAPAAHPAPSNLQSTS